MASKGKGKSHDIAFNVGAVCLFGFVVLVIIAIILACWVGVCAVMAWLVLWAFHTPFLQTFVAFLVATFLIGLIGQAFSHK